MAAVLPTPRAGGLPVPAAQRPSILVNEVDFAGLPSDLASQTKDSMVTLGAALSSTQRIELFNRNGQPYTMSGWTVETASGTYSIPDTVIQARDYIVLVGDIDYIRRIFPEIPAPLVQLAGGDAGSVGLDAASDHVLLRDRSGKAMSAPSYGADATVFSPGIKVVGAGHSLEREPIGRETGTASDFADRFPPTPGGPDAPLIFLSAPPRLPAQEATRDSCFSPIPTPLEFLSTPVIVLAANMLLAIMVALVFGACSR